MILPCPRCNKIEDSYHTYCSECRNVPIKKKEYKMICSKHAQELSDRATALLNEGWELYGSPSIPGYSDENGLINFAYCQAFIKNAID